MTIAILMDNSRARINVCSHHASLKVRSRPWIGSEWVLYIWKCFKISATILRIILNARHTVKFWCWWILNNRQFNIFVYTCTTRVYIVSPPAITIFCKYNNTSQQDPPILFVCLPDLTRYSDDGKLKIINKWKEYKLMKLFNFMVKCCTAQYYLYPYNVKNILKL